MSHSGSLVVDGTVDGSFVVTVHGSFAAVHGSFVVTVHGSFVTGDGSLVALSAR